MSDIGNLTPFMKNEIDKDYIKERVSKEIEKCIENKSDSLFLNMIYLTDFPSIPPVKYLDCTNMIIKNFPEHLPDTIEHLRLEICNLKMLPILPKKLKILSVHLNQFTQLPTLPNTLEKLYCGCNQLESLPPLPDTLEGLWCFNNKFKKLPKLPSNLKTLICFHNSLCQLPELPLTMETLKIYETSVLRQNKMIDNAYLYIPDHICDQFNIQKTPNYPKIIMSLKKIIIACKRIKKLRFCDQLQPQIDQYHYRPMGHGYHELTERNKGLFIDL